MAKELQRILYVEDEEDIQTIVVMVLESIGGFSMVSCTSGKQAIEVAPGANADLILLDVMMPGLDGPATFAALRKMPQTAATPVVFMTAMAQASEIARLKSMGALDVITKPFDAMALPEQISAIWNRWAGLAAPAGPRPLPPVKASTELELKALDEKFSVELPAQIAEIERLIDQVTRGADANTLATLHRSLHSLAGSGEVFGFKSVGDCAKNMELVLEPCLSESILGDRVRIELARGLDDLKRLVNVA